MFQEEQEGEKYALTTCCTTPAAMARIVIGEPNIFGGLLWKPVAGLKEQIRYSVHKQEGRIARDKLVAGGPCAAPTNKYLWSAVLHPFFQIVAKSRLNAERKNCGASKTLNML